MAGRTTNSGRATIKDVASLASVDPSLVSRILNGDPKGSASAETRQRIFAAASELGYQPSLAARSLRMSRAFTLGLLLPDVANPVYASIIRGAEERSQERGFGLALGIHSEGGSEETFTRALEQGRVDGLLVASGSLRDSFIKALADAGKGPVIVINRRVRGVKSSVVIDDSAGARAATEHLIGLGHRRIAGIFAPAHIDTAQRRMSGFLQACTAGGAEPSFVEVDGWDEHAGYLATREVLSVGRPTAIFASALLMGVGALRAVREASLRVPEDVSVVALHDGQVADYTFPQLTTVAMPTYELGITAVDEMVALLDGGAHKRLMIATPPKLIRRESSGAPPLSSR